MFVTTYPHGTFHFLSLQVCNINNAIPPQTVTFTGTKGDGSNVSQTFHTPGFNDTPQTFAPANFGGLMSLEIDRGSSHSTTSSTRLRPSRS
jgi:hypothetical protein